MAACPHKRKNGPPISPTKLGQRIARLLLFGSVGGGKNYAPARGDKLARSIPTAVFRLFVHERTLWSSLFYTSNKRRIHRPQLLASRESKSNFREKAINSLS